MPTIDESSSDYSAPTLSSRLAIYTRGMGRRLFLPFKVIYPKKDLLPVHIIGSIEIHEFIYLIALKSKR